ncbi:MAG: TIGR02206 family membrane protein [Prosthecobacter sp.]|jgi:hypothetical integral membrane protein (TIGR02206 family)|nr:TIGR02206 family membrane protein [Prosthecobacter sp.]
MTEAAPFHAFSPSHQVVLAMTVLCLLVLAFLQKWSPRGAVLAERLLGTLLLLAWPATSYGHWQGGTFSWDNALPCHFCDVAAIGGGIALWTRHRLACEIVYFFGMAGTLQGLLTPNLKADFPDARFFAFFLIHAGVVIAALHVVTAMRCPPRPGAVRRMFGVTMLYAASAAALNQALGTNYGFLCRKPEAASLMDHLGPWPWYIGSLIGLCVLFYAVLNAPFALSRWLASRRQ